MKSLTALEVIADQGVWDQVDIRTNVCGKDILQKMAQILHYWNENGENLRSTAAHHDLQNCSSRFAKPNTDQFWSVFHPFPELSLNFHPLHTHTKHTSKKISPPLDFLALVKAQTFCTNSGRVANAYSTDKYKYKIMKKESDELGNQLNICAPLPECVFNISQICFQTSRSILPKLFLLFCRRNT